MYIIFTTINFGFLTSRIFNIKQSSAIINSILGLFATTIIASIWAIFYRINWEFHLFLLLFNGLLLLRHKKETFLLYRNFIFKINTLILPLKIIAAVTTALILAQCATKPYIIDNESYYIQTIKWLNEFGFVNGLANLHIFFGQNSGWHITQSVFNFSFLYFNLNDLSGFCLLLGNLFALFKLNDYFKYNDQNALLFGLLPLANLFFFQFISAPSPDIPVYIFTFILFSYFIKYYHSCTSSEFSLMVILVLYILYIKPTSVALLLLPSLLLFKNQREILPKVGRITLLCAVVLFLFIIKNTIVSGYPFFPFATVHGASLEYRVPEKIVSFFYFNETKANVFYTSFSEFKDLSKSELFYKWLFTSKIDFMMNAGSLLVIFITPLYLRFYNHSKPIWILFGTISVQMIVLFLSAPQYRFFIHFVFFLVFLMASSYLKNKKTLLLINTVSLLAVSFFLFIPIHFGAVTNNPLLAKNTTFSSKNLFIPEANSKYAIDYKIIRKGNLIYNSPVNHPFFWGNGNGKLPCVNQKQMDYFEQHFQVIPQLRTKNLKDGFYAKTSTTNE